MLLRHQANSVDIFVDLHLTEINFYITIFVILYRRDTSDIQTYVQSEAQ